MAVLSSRRFIMHASCAQFSSWGLPQLSRLSGLIDQVGDFHKAVSAMTRNPEQFFLSGDELGRRFEFVKVLDCLELCRIPPCRPLIARDG